MMKLIVAFCTFANVPKSMCLMGNYLVPRNVYCYNRGIVQTEVVIITELNCISLWCVGMNKIIVQVVTFIRP